MDTLYGGEWCYILQKAVIMKYSNNTSKKNSAFSNDSALTSHSK